MLTYTPALRILRRVSSASLGSVATGVAHDILALPHLSASASSVQLRALSGSGKDRQTGGDGGNLSHLVRETLEKVATVSTEGASAFFKPQAVSPLSTLRPAAPPSASDARPFGHLNRGNRLGKYVNANRLDAPDTTTTASSAGVAPSPAAAPVAAVIAPEQPSATPMHLGKLLRTPHRAPTLTNTSSNSSRNTGSSHSTHDRNDLSSTEPSTGQRPPTLTSSAVERAQATIAAAEAQRREAAAAAANHKSFVGSAASSPSSSTVAGSSDQAKNHDRDHHQHHQQLYREHCTIGWSPQEFYDVVADVARYPSFLPWCLEAQVHSSRRVRLPAREVARKSPHYYETVVLPIQRAREAAGETAETALVDAVEMRATLWVGFSFFKEHYTSVVTLLPGAHITAALADESDGVTAAAASSEEGLLASLFRKAADSTGVSAVKKSILKSLICEWDFVPVEDNANEVEVSFSVSFEFKNPMHAKMIMNNIVSLMTRSFERQCERLYGPPSAQKRVLPLPML